MFGHDLKVIQLIAQSPRAIRLTPNSPQLSVRRPIRIRYVDNSWLVCEEARDMVRVLTALSLTAAA